MFYRVERFFGAAKIMAEDHDDEASVDDGSLGKEVGVFIERDVGLAEERINGHGTGDQHKDTHDDYCQKRPDSSDSHANLRQILSDVRASLSAPTFRSSSAAVVLMRTGSAWPASVSLRP